MPLSHHRTRKTPSEMKGEESISPPSLLLLHQLLCLLDNMADADSELLHGDGARSGGTEAIQSDHSAVVADILVPAHRRAGFNCQLGGVLGEDRGLVGIVLLLEELEA